MNESIRKVGAGFVLGTIVALVAAAVLLSSLAGCIPVPMCTWARTSDMGARFMIEHEFCR